MPVELFSAGMIDFSINEGKMYDKIKKEMVDFFSHDEKRYCVIVDYIIGNKQYDIIVIKNDAIISIDLKSYKGKIIGSENGSWFVETDDSRIEINQRKNPFIQVRDQRYQLLGLLNDILPKVFKRLKDDTISNVASILCFENGSTYDIEQINHKMSLWFNVMDESNLFKFIESTTSNQFYFKDIEIDKLLQEMNVQKLDDNENKVILDISNKSVISSEDIMMITERIMADFGTNGFTLQDISGLVDPEVAVRYLKESIDSKIINKIGNDNKFCLDEKWADNLPSTISNADNDLYISNDVSKYAKADFSLRPNNSKEGTEYNGVYRGTTYHLNYMKDVWWAASKDYFKVKAKFSNEDILDKILNIKPQGGSFRITEAKEVLTKIYLEDRGYVSFYVGKFDGEIELDNCQWNPKLTKGDLWPSMYDGTTFSVNTNKEILMHIGNIKVYSKEGGEELANKVLSFRENGGGRFKVNENGCILTLMHKVPYPKNIKKQLDKLTDVEKNLIDMREKTDGDGMVPIYIGKFRGNIKFKKIFDIQQEWTDEDDDDFLKRIGGSEL